MFAGTLKYMGESSEEVSFETAVEIAQKLLHQAIKRPDLKDELYMHLIKQTRGNPNNRTKLKAWELFFLVASTVPPSKLYIGLVSEYIHSLANDENENDELRKKAEATWRALKRSAKAGARHTLPSFEEIDAALKSQNLQTIVFFLDETFEELKYDITTTVLEAVEQLASIIKLQHYTTFTLFESRKFNDRTAAEQNQDEHVLLDDHKYIADVLYEIRTSARAGKEAYTSRLLFKKRMFRETDETVTETVFVNLSYVQAQFDYLQGNYPVVRDDASQMCALQVQAESGPTLIDQEEVIMTCIEKCVPSIMRAPAITLRPGCSCINNCASCVLVIASIPQRTEATWCRYITKAVLMTRPRDEWLMDVMGRYKALEQFSNEEARLQFLRILRSLPYGNSIFFAVKRIEDPIGLLPAKLILGINKRGVHFFRPVPKEYLHSAELRDIMQFGSSTQVWSTSCNSMYCENPDKLCGVELS